MKKYGYVISGVTALTGIFLYFLTGRFEVSELDDLGPAFWPRILCIALIICSVFLMGETFFRYGKKDEAVSFFATQYQKTAWSAIGIILAFTVMIKVLGFYLSAFLYLPAMLWLLGERNKKRILILDAAAIAAVYVVFRVLLRVQLPAPMFL